MQCDNFILISTVDVYDIKSGVDEDYIINPEKADYYGRNRLEFEKFVKDKFPKFTIIRLPALFGSGLKKNFIYDLLNPVPMFLTQKLFSQWEGILSQEDLTVLSGFYSKRSDGVFEKISKENDTKTLEIFSKIGFSSLSFTDSRHSFQFYNLANLWKDIQTAINNGIELLNLVTEPVTTSEIYRYGFGKDFVNEVAQNIMHYDIYSRFADSGHYFYTKEIVLKEIKEFLELNNCELPA